MQHFLGIDVSKAKLDVALTREAGKYRCKVFSNDPQGFDNLVQWLTQQTTVSDVQVCMEATGTYHEALACCLHERGLWVAVINPLLTKRFAQAQGLRNKTDQVDAKSLALFCQKQQPARWQPPSPGVRALQALAARLDTLQDMRQAESNRLEVAHPSVRTSIDNVITELDTAIAVVKEQIDHTIGGDPDLKRDAALLDTIPGLGERTIAQLLAYIGSAQRFHSVKAVTAYASLSPMIRQSGTSLNRGSGTHPMGHQGLKHALYFPAMVAGRHNPLVADFWHRLEAQGKPGKVIVVACMHKLLAIAYGVLRSGKPFDANYLHPSPKKA